MRTLLLLLAVACAARAESSTQGRFILPAGWTADAPPDDTRFRANVRSQERPLDQEQAEIAYRASAASAGSASALRAGRLGERRAWAYALTQPAGLGPGQARYTVMFSVPYGTAHAWVDLSAEGPESDGASLKRDLSRLARSFKRSTADADLAAVQAAFAWHIRRNGPVPVDALEAVCAHAPATVPVTYRKGDVRVIRFFDQVAFRHYCAWAQANRSEEQVVWEPNIYALAFYLLGFCRVEAGDLAGAAEALERARKLEPANSQVLSELGHVRHRQGRLEEALALYDATKTVGPLVSPGLLARALRGRGCVLIDLSRFADARAAFEQSLALEPGNAIAQRELALLDDHKRNGGQLVLSDDAVITQDQVATK